MNLDKKEIAKRFKQYLIEKYGSIEKGAEAINKSSQSLRSNYLSGNSLPGAELISDLIKDGCDINWLLLGTEPLEKASTSADMKVSINKVSKKSEIQGEQNDYLSEISPEEREVIMKLRLVPEAQKTIDRLLSGLVETKEALKEVGNLYLQNPESYIHPSSRSKKP
jgi:transcriptional regulator with XRE-family HTH domain